MIFLRILNRLFYLMGGFFLCVAYFGLYTPSLQRDTAGIALFAAIGGCFLVLGIAGDLADEEGR